MNPSPLGLRLKILRFGRSIAKLFHVEVSREIAIAESIHCDVILTVVLLLYYKSEFGSKEIDSSAQNLVFRS